MKQAITSMDIEWQYMVIIAMLVVRMVMKLHTAITTAEPTSRKRLVKRNFMRKSIGNHTAMPARVA